VDELDKEVVAVRLLVMVLVPDFVPVRVLVLD